LLRGRIGCGVALLAAAVAVAGFGLVMQPLDLALDRAFRDYEPLSTPVFLLAALLAALGIWYLAIAARRRG
jgi:hypothetical protein